MEQNIPQSPSGDSSDSGGQAFGFLPPTPSAEEEADSNAYRFTPQRQRRWLEAYSQLGTITGASKAVGISRETVYAHRAANPSFASAMRSANLIARDISEEEFSNRALNGWQEEVWYRGELVGHRQRHDNRLLLAHMARLDKAAEKMGAINNVREKAHLHAGIRYFDEILDAIEHAEDITPILRRDDYQIWEDLETALQHDRQMDYNASKAMVEAAESDEPLEEIMPGYRYAKHRTRAHEVFSPEQCQNVSGCSEMRGVEESGEEEADPPLNRFERRAKDAIERQAKKRRKYR